MRRSWVRIPPSAPEKAGLVPAFSIPSGQCVERSGCMSKLEFAQKYFENLLHKDENLKCFFWGNVDESNFRKNGYFALTETHFLAVFVSGTRVIDTVRMPLRIESVKIKT